MGYSILKSMLGLGIVLLFVQFWLGMNLNLFVSLPMRLPSDFFSYAGGDELFAHVFVGMVVFVLAGLVLSYGSRLRSIRFLALSVFGFVLALVAVATGATFALRGHENIISLAMAMSFLLFLPYF
jgi:hypothetical protein